MRTPAEQRSARSSTRDSVLDTLRRRIISLEFPPGHPLSENDLAKELGVSRTPVRESLILLREEGLIEVYPQVGSFVSLVDIARVSQAQFVREAIECASLADTPGRGAEDLAVVRANLARQREAVDANDAERFFELDEEFHRELLRLGGHVSAWAAVNSAKAHLDRARRLSLTGTRPLAILLEQHTAVVDAVEAQDTSGAIDALRTHLRAVFDDIERIQAASPELFAGSEPARPTRRTVARLS
jgi:DNA-binding GntR family transcriptional regulator